MRYLLLLPMLLCFPTKAHALPKLISHCSAAIFNNHSTDPAICTVTGVLTNDIIATVSSSCGPLASFPTDTLGLTYTNFNFAAILGFSVTTCNFRNHTLQVNYACVTSGSGSDTVTQLANGGVGYSPAMIVGVFRGVTCTQDGSGVNNNAIAANTGSQSAGTLSTSSTYDLLVAGALTDGTTAFCPTANNGFNLVECISTEWGGNECVSGFCQTFMAMSWKVVPASGTPNCTFNFLAGGTIENSGAVCGAFGPGTGVQPPHRAKEIKYRRRKYAVLYRKRT